MSDAIDAEMAARQALSNMATAIPKATEGIVESIRMLRVARESAIKSRSAALTQLSDLTITAPDELRQQLSICKTTRGKATICSKLRPDPKSADQPTQAAKLALRSLAKRIESLDTEISALDKHLDQLVTKAAPRTTSLLAVSTSHAGQLLVTAGQNIERLRSEASFAALCGTNPIPASSGKTNRHRLNYGGHRDANRSLHMIAVCRLRYCERTRKYTERRIKEGKTKKEIIRCLKRYIAREIYNTLLKDLTKCNTTTNPCL